MFACSLQKASNVTGTGSYCTDSLAKSTCAEAAAAATASGGSFPGRLGERLGISMGSSPLRELPRRWPPFFASEGAGSACALGGALLASATLSALSRPPAQLAACSQRSQK